MKEPVEMNDIETQWNLSISKDRVTDGLGKCFLYMIEVTYRANQSKYNHNINLEDEMRHKALMALLTYWSKWDYNKGNIVSYFLTLIKSNFIYAISYESRFPREAQELSDDCVIGCWDESFDNIKLTSEIEKQKKIDGKWTQAKYIKQYHQRRAKEDPEYLKKRREYSREYYHKHNKSAVSNI